MHGCCVTTLLNWMGAVIFHEFCDLICSCIEKFINTKVVFRSRKSLDRQCNDEKKGSKMTKNDLQNTTQEKKIEKHEQGSKMVILGCPNQRLLYCHNSKCNNFVALHYNFKHQVSNSNNYLFLYMCVYCQENKTIIVVFSILIHYYRYFRPPYILGLSQTPTFI